MDKSVFGGLVRHVLTILGGGLISAGYITAEELSTAAGAIIALLGVAWSVFTKVKGAKQLPAVFIVPVLCLGLSGCGHFEKPVTPKQKYAAAETQFAALVGYLDDLAERGKLKGDDLFNTQSAVVAVNNTLKLWKTAVQENDEAKIEQYRLTVIGALADLERIYTEVKQRK